MISATWVGSSALGGADGIVFGHKLRRAARAGLGAVGDDLVGPIGGLAVLALAPGLAAALFTRAFAWLSPGVSGGLVEGDFERFHTE